MAFSDNQTHRLDLRLVAEMVPPGTRVLDVGCGDGALLALLAESRQVDARGIELSREGVAGCVARGLSVIQGDADTDLFDFPDRAFDYVVLSQTLQAMRAPRKTLDQLLRIGGHAIVSMPNFAHWRLRWRLLTRGRMPVSDALPYPWYDSPNIHLCTIRDFVALCGELDARIERGLFLDQTGTPRRLGAALTLANLLGEQAVFLLCRNGR